jgi:hypothetical protein
MRESAIEKYLVKQVKVNGGQIRKFLSPGNTGVADRIVGFYPGRFAFVELKSPGKPLKPHQEREASKWKKLGFYHIKIDSLKDVDDFISRMTFQES